MRALDPKVFRALKKARVTDARRHLFLCLGPDCCAPEAGQATWEYIKQRTKELDLPVMRTKALCFRICHSGPWLVVYPEGIWYAKVTPKRFERILRDHLLGGKPVTKWMAARNPLAASLRTTGLRDNKTTRPRTVKARSGAQGAKGKGEELGGTPDCSGSG